MEFNLLLQKMFVSFQLVDLIFKFENSVIAFDLLNLVLI